MLKVGAPVMLIKNLSDTLVNGLRGKVAKLKQEEVIVHFPSLSRSHTFKAEKFTRLAICSHNITTTPNLIRIYQEPCWKIIIGAIYYCEVGYQYCRLYVRSELHAHYIGFDNYEAVVNEENAAEWVVNTVGSQRPHIVQVQTTDDLRESYSILFILLGMTISIRRRSQGSKYPFYCVTPQQFTSHKACQLTMLRYMQKICCTRHYWL